MASAMKPKAERILLRIIERNRGAGSSEVEFTSDDILTVSGELGLTYRNPHDLP